MSGTSADNGRRRGSERRREESQLLVPNQGRKEKGELNSDEELTFVDVTRRSLAHPTQSNVSDLCWETIFPGRYRINNNKDGKEVSLSSNRRKESSRGRREGRRTYRSKMQH